MGRVTCSSCIKSSVLLQGQTMKLLILLVGLILILEGIPYVAAPEAMQEWLKKLSEIDPSQLRSFGIVAMIVGFSICFVVQKTPLFQ